MIFLSNPIGTRIRYKIRLHLGYRSRLPLFLLSLVYLSPNIVCLVKVYMKPRLEILGSSTYCVYKNKGGISTVLVPNLSSPQNDFRCVGRSLSRS